VSHTVLMQVGPGLFSATPEGREGSTHRRPKKLPAGPAVLVQVGPRVSARRPGERVYPLAAYGREKEWPTHRAPNETVKSCRRGSRGLYGGGQIMRSDKIKNYAIIVRYYAILCINYALFLIYGQHIIRIA